LYDLAGKMLIDENRFEKLNRDVNRIMQYIKTERIEAHRVNTISSDLTDKETKVLRYIETYPDSTKQKIVEYFKGEMARATVFRTLDELVKFGIVNDKLDLNNRQTHRLAVNYESIYFQSIQELDKFKNAFFALIDRTAVEYNRSKVSAIREKEFSQLYSELILIYLHVLGTYITYAILKWPKKIKDKEILTKLYATVFSRMVEILSRLSESFQISYGLPKFGRATIKDAFSPILQTFVISTFLLRTAKLKQVYESGQKHKIAKEMESVLDIAWKISFDVYPYSDLDIDLLPRQLEELKDWRKALWYYESKLKAA
jgi:Fe2+ or Zn2+ uptake regulation protein